MNGAEPAQNIIPSPSQKVDGDLMFSSREEVEDVAQRRWLKNREVLEVLRRWKDLGLRPSSEIVQQPPSGQILVYDRAVVKHFRRDNHEWKKKRDGKTVREDHEKLKIDGVKLLTCCYAHGEAMPSFHRRIYWLLPPVEGSDSDAVTPRFDESNNVLVHYLDEKNISAEADTSKRRGGASRSAAVQSPSQLPTSVASAARPLSSRRVRTSAPTTPNLGHDAVRPDLEGTPTSAPATWGPEEAQNLPYADNAAPAPDVPLEEANSGPSGRGDGAGLVGDVHPQGPELGASTFPTSEMMMYGQSSEGGYGHGGGGESVLSTAEQHWGQLVEGVRPHEHSNLYPGWETLVQHSLERGSDHHLHGLYPNWEVLTGRMQMADHKTHLERARSERAVAESAWVGDHGDDEAMDLDDHKGTHNLWDDDPFSMSQGHAEVGGGLMAYECAMEEDPSGPMLEQATYKTREDWQRFLKNSEDAHARQGVAKSIAFDAMQSNLQRGGEVAQEWADLSKKARGAHEAGGCSAETNGWGDGGGGMEGMD